MALRTSEFTYELPEDLIAAYPPADRLDARLMVVNRATGQWSHRSFRDLRSLLDPSDLLVLNNTKVNPSFLESADGRLTALLLEETSPRHWIALVKPGKFAKPGQRVTFRGHGSKKQVDAEVLQTMEDGSRIFRFYDDLDLESFGEMPIPPYILRRRQDLLNAGQLPPVIDDRSRYQTVYAHKPGSVAAPTAGLHFTPEYLAQFRHTFLTLHVGLGTFRPVKTELVREHEMHSERFSVPPGFAEAATEGGRLVAIGTTTARVLESVKTLQPHGGKTNIFIYPPYEFKRVQALVTNFHLPKSTLLMLVSAFAGTELIRAAYAEAVRERYRFFSYGDAMLIL